MRTFSRTISLPPFPPRTRAVILVFNVTRASPVQPPLEASQVFRAALAGELELGGRFPNVVTLGVRTGLGALARQRSSIELVSLNDPAELVRVVVQTEEQLLRLQAPAAGPCLTDADLLLAQVWVPVHSPAGLVFGPEEYADDMLLALGGLPSGSPQEALRRKQTQYFARLNALTESKLNGFLGPIQPILNQNIVNTFIGVQRRQAHFLKELRMATLPGPLPAFESATYANPARDVAAAFDLAQGDNQMSDADVEEAFLAFARGALRLQLPTHLAWTTQPSSGFFFLFGEFAQLAYECGLGAGWLQLARTLCMARELLVQSYPPAKGVALDVDAYSPCRYVPPPEEDPRIPLLRADFDALSEAELVRRSAEQTDQHLSDIPLPP